LDSGFFALWVEEKAREFNIEINPS
jgi:hypothetical protein